jgi:hypothetical protein
MQLRIMLKPTLLPFLRVRGINPMQQRRAGLFVPRTQLTARTPTTGKGRRLSS